MSGFAKEVIAKLKGMTSEEIDAVFDKLCHGKREERRKAAEEIDELIRWGIWQKEAVPDFFNRINHDVIDVMINVITKEKDPEVIYKCNNCLGNYGNAAAKAEDTLIRCLSNKSEDVRLTAARTLGAVSRNRGRLIPLMFDILRKDGIGARDAAAGTIRALVPLDDCSLDDLIALAIKERNHKVKWELLRIVSVHGARSERIIPFLKKLVCHKEFLLRSIAAISLFRISNVREDKMLAMPILVEISRSCATISIFEVIEAIERSRKDIPEADVILVQLAKGEFSSSLSEFDQDLIRERAKHSLSSELPMQCSL